MGWAPWTPCGLIPGSLAKARADQTPTARCSSYWPPCRPRPVRELGGRAVGILPRRLRPPRTIRAWACRRGRDGGSGSAWYDVTSHLDDRLDGEDLLDEQRAEAKPAVAGAEGLLEGLHRSLDLIRHDHDELSRE